MPRYTIEIAGPRNDSAIFPPIGNERLRGRWDNAKVAHRNKINGEAGEALKELSLAVDTVPGLFISLSTDGAGEGNIVDPLGETDPGKSIREKIKQVLSRFSSNVLDCGSDPRPRSTYSDLGVDGCKEWAFYMRTMIDSGIAQLVAGSPQLPTVAEIKKWPGKRRRDPLNTGTQDADTMADMKKGHGLYRWTDEVPEGDELVGAGAPSGPPVGGAGEGGTTPPAGRAGRGSQNNNQ